MNKRIALLSVGILCTAIVVAQESYKVTVEITQPTSDYKVFMSSRQGESSQIDSLIIKDGKFVTTGKVAELSSAFIYVIPQDVTFADVKRKKGMPFYLEAGNIQIAVLPSLKQIKISGTSSNADLQAFNDIMSSYYTKMDATEKEYRIASEKKDASGMINSRNAYEALEKEMDQAKVDFFNTHPDSPVSFDWLKASFSPIQEKSKAMALYSKMGPKIKGSSAGKAYEEMLTKTKAVELNAEAPDFTCTTSTGEELKLSSLRGQYVLIDFWASWCGPCRRENPYVLKAYNTYNAKNFTVLGVSLDNSKDSWLKAIEKDALPWQQVSDLKGWGSAPGQMYGIRSIPSNFLLNPQGVIIAHNLRGDELEKKLEEVLK